jgi:hypothetical protein
MTINFESARDTYKDDPFVLDLLDALQELRRHLEQCQEHNTQFRAIAEQMSAMGLYQQITGKCALCDHLLPPGTPN